MLLAISSQKSAIAKEIRQVQRVGSKLSSRFHQFKQFRQFKTVLALIQKHLRYLQGIEKYDAIALSTFQIEPYTEASQRIKNHLLRKSKELKQLINDATFGAYATQAQESLAKICFNLCLIEGKMEEALKTIKELQIRLPDEGMLIE